jgi:hypothetical protein
MPDKPKDPKPTYDDIVRDWGYDKMAFFCDMVRPDQHEEREDEGMPDATSRAPEVTLDPEHERAIIEGIEKYLGRKPTQQEIHLALEQARSL